MKGCAMETAMLRGFDAFGSDLARLRAAIAESPIRLAPPAEPASLSSSLSWDQIRHSPDVDRFILNWIVGHVPRRLHRHMH
jgi:hypothetical protein